MIPLLDMAMQVPDDYRKEFLELNVIDNSRPMASDNNMMQLYIVWRNYFEPGLEIGCGACLERVRNNWMKLKPFLITLENESKLLDSL